MADTKALPKPDNTDDELKGSEAPLLDHLIELRKRLIFSVAAIAVFFVACFAFAQPLYNVLTLPFVWAAGDVIGNQTESQLAKPVGAHDGVIVAKNALAGAHQKIDHRVIPRTIFTDPQVAVVGQTDEEAVGSGLRCWCGTIPLDLVPRAGATHQTNGIAKMVINRDTHEVVGVSLVMPNAGEVIHEAAMAMRFHAKLEDYIDMIHVYPTMAEALKIAAISYFKDPSKLSCCAE